MKIYPIARHIQQICIDSWPPMKCECSTTFKNQKTVFNNGIMVWNITTVPNKALFSRGTMLKHKNYFKEASLYSVLHSENYLDHPCEFCVHIFHKYKNKNYPNKTEINHKNGNHSNLVISSFNKVCQPSNTLTERLTYKDTERMLTPSRNPV